MVMDLLSTIIIKKDYAKFTKNCGLEKWYVANKFINANKINKVTFLWILIVLILINQYWLWIMFKMIELKEIACKIKLSKRSLLLLL